MIDEADAALDQGPSRRAWGPWRSEVGSFAELFGLAGLAVAQPTFSSLTRSVGVLVPLRLTRADVIEFVVLTVVLPPMVLWLLEVASGVFGRRVRDVVHRGFAGLLAAVLVIEVVKRAPGHVVTPSTPLLLVVGAIGLVVMYALLSWSLVRQWLRLLAFAPLLFGLLFTWSGPVTTVLDAGGARAAGAAIKKPHRVVMIVMDELPEMSLLDGEGKIDASLFPNFDALAHGSTWYRNISTVASFTEAAVPAILTGATPAVGKTPVVADYPRNLFTLLGGRYVLNVHESLTRLCPVRLCHAAPSRGRTGLSALIADGREVFTESAAPRPPKRDVGSLGSLFVDPLGTGRDFVKSLRPTSKPTLDFLHVLLPHQPWHTLAGGRDYFPSEQVKGALFGSKSVWGGAFQPDGFQQRHLLQLQAADWLLGRIVARLKAIGAYDDSLIVLTADHGIAFQENGLIRGATTANYPHILWTPLFIKAPGQTASATDDQPVESIDILPTIADYLGVRVPWPIDGRSLLANRRAEGTRTVLNEFAVDARQPGVRLHFDGATGFASVVRARASDASGDPATRLYRLGPFGSLVGRPTASRRVSHSSVRGASVTAIGGFAHVDVRSLRPLWTFAREHVQVGPNQWIAISVNGVIAGLARTGPGPGTTHDISAMLAPNTFRNGANDVRSFVIRGTPQDPELVPIRSAAGG